MKIKMMTLYAGPNGVMQNGEVCNVDEETGRTLVAGRYAIELKTPVAVETTAAPVAPIERAVIEEPAAPVSVKPERKAKK